MIWQSTMRTSEEDVLFLEYNYSQLLCVGDAAVNVVVCEVKDHVHRCPSENIQLARCLTFTLVDTRPLNETCFRISPELANTVEEHEFCRLGSRLSIRS
ncbi:hypothetical protein ACTXT7_007863 [Hymenolepis weldensis]